MAVTVAELKRYLEGWDDNLEVELTTREVYAGPGHSYIALDIALSSIVEDREFEATL